MSDLHHQIQEGIQALEQIRKIKAHISLLQDRLTEEENILANLEKSLEKEKRDVEILEREGLTSMFYTFLGDLEEKLEKEREEHLRVSLRYNEILKSVQLIRYELDVLSQKDLDEDTAARRIESLIAYREEELLQLGAEAAARLKELHNKTDKLNAAITEVDEAMAAGLKALGFTRQTERLLEEARKWGERDMWGGRHHATGHLKHQSIDQARDMAQQARHALIAFGNELKDVFQGIEFTSHLHIEDTRRFMDIFLDNLITDWQVQRKINKSLAGITLKREQIEVLLNHLEERKSEIQSELQNLEKKRTQIIIHAKDS